MHNICHLFSLVQSGLLCLIFSFGDIIKVPGLLNGSRIHKLMMLVKARPGLIKALGFFVVCFSTLLWHTSCGGATQSRQAQIIQINLHLLLSSNRPKGQSENNRGKNGKREIRKQSNSSLLLMSVSFLQLKIKPLRFGNTKILDDAPYLFFQ